MPFQSEQQRKWMYAKFPTIAARWEKETAAKKLPKYKHPEEKPLHTYLKSKK